MPASAPLSGAMLRSHGDVFLAADRKNRMERVRLDKQIRVFDKDQARHEFSIERQKRTLVHKWKVVSTTTGHSEKAMPPEGPQDNVYEKCKHSRNKLSERRLMQWKVCERQLEKFLRQFREATPTSVKPRPSSSRSAYGGRRQPQMDVVAHRLKMLEFERQRSVSVVSFAPTAEIVTRGAGRWDEDGELATNDDEGTSREQDYGDRDHVLDSTGSKFHLFRSGLRSSSMASFNTYDDLGKLISPRHPSTPPAKSQSLWASDDVPFMSEIPEETRIPSPALVTAPSATQVADILKSSTRRYHDFLRASSFSSNKFFVTKDNVVMTNTLQQTYKELQVNSDGSDSGVQKQTRGRLLGVAPRSAPGRVSSRSDNMSESSSLSSDDMEENVFVDSPEKRSELAVTDLELLSNCGDGRGSAVEADTENVSRDSIETENNLKLPGPDCIEQRTASDSPAERSGSVSSQKIMIGTVAAESSVESPRQIQSVSAPMKKMTIADGKEVRASSSSSAARNGGDSKRLSFDRRRSTSHLLHISPLRPSTTDGNAVGRASLFVGKAADITGRPSAKTSLLAKRRQSSAALLIRSNVADPTKTATTSASSLTSAMTVTSLRVNGGKDGQPQTARPSIPSQRKQLAETFSRCSSPQATAANNTPGPFPLNAASHSRMPQLRGKDPSSDVDDADTASNAGDFHPVSQWRRDLAIEQPEGMRTSVRSLSTVLKAAMVFSKTARRRALSTMVEENNVDTREAIRKERLRKLQSRASVLSKIVAQFRPGHEEE